MGKRRTFSPEERLSILKEGEREGQASTCRKCNIAPSFFLRWKRIYLNKGYEGFKPSYNRVDPEKRAEEEENERLKIKE